MDFHTRFSPPPRVVRRFVQPSRTRQEYARECDINYILARVGAGQIELVPPEATYADITDVPTQYEEIAGILLDADQRFAALPAKLRDRFGNDPVALIQFLGDARNRDEAVRLGLIAPGDSTTPTTTSSKTAEGGKETPNEVLED